MKYTSIREQVEYGLERINEDDSIEVPLKDLLFVYKLIEELNRFFHQPMHYPDITSVKEYLGDYKKEGAFSLISDAYYQKFGNILPERIKEMVESDDFSHPNYPFYYKKK